MENHQSISMDQHFFRESWKDVKGFGGVQDLCYSTTGWSSGPSSPSASSQTSGQVDKVLYKNLVEMVPLVQSLMDHRVNKSFSHRASLIYTPTPSRDRSSKKMSEQKGKKTLQTTCATKRTERNNGLLSEHCNNINMENQEHIPDELSICSSRLSEPEGQQTSNGEKAETVSNVNGAELFQLQSQIEALEKKLVEKDELLKSAENSVSQLDSMRVKVEELQLQIQQKDSLIQSAHIQLSQKKNELANLQAHLKKAEDDAKASNQKVKKVEEDLDGLQRQIAAFISFFEIAEQKAASSTSQGIKSSEDVEIDPNFSIQDSDANCLYKETVEDENYAISSELDRAEVEEIEHARRMYLAAVIAAKNNPGEESLSLAADLRVQLQQFLLRPALENALDDQLSVQALSFPAS
eukprot:Gb_13301 [translate_table: standard]